MKLHNIIIELIFTVFGAAIEVTDEAAALEMETLLAFIEAITAWTDPEDAAVTMLSELPGLLCNDGSLPRRT